MVFTLDGNSEISAHTCGEISVIRSDYNTCLDREQSQICFFFSSEKTFFRHKCATCSELLISNLSSMELNNLKFLVIMIWFLVSINSKPFKHSHTRESIKKGGN